MAKPVLGGVTLEGCENIGIQKNANIIPLTLPTGGSDDTVVYDLLGVIRNFTLSGTYSTGSIASTKSFADALQALIDGNQSTVTFTSDQAGTVSAMVADIRIDWPLPGFHLSYNIKLIEGKDAF